MWHHLTALVYSYGLHTYGLYRYGQVAPLDCTGCGVCVQVCPEDALSMTPFATALVDNDMEARWDYLRSLPTREDNMRRTSVQVPTFLPLMSLPPPVQRAAATVLSGNK